MLRWLCQLASLKNPYLNTYSHRPLDAATMWPCQPKRQRVRWPWCDVCVWRVGCGSLDLWELMCLRLECMSNVHNVILMAVNVGRDESSVSGWFIEFIMLNLILIYHHLNYFIVFQRCDQISHVSIITTGATHRGRAIDVTVKFWKKYNTVIYTKNRHTRA